MAARATKIHTTKLPSGVAVPVLGQGTWHFGEYPVRRAEEIESIRRGLDLGMTLIDTAEMYGDGAAEELIAEAIQGRRDEVFLVSKVLPHHATFDGIVAACTASRRRLQTEWLDLYLLHWRGDIALGETIEAFKSLAESGKIRYWGVSNFDMTDMKEVLDQDEGNHVATDQVLYSLAHRGIEYDLLPWCQRRRIPVMAYSPIEQGGLIDHPTLRKIAHRHRVTPAQIALAWVLRSDGVVAIPKASSPAHMQENRAAIDVKLSDHDLQELDHVFPPPKEKQPLDIY